jgi:lipopolysaccharide biosynthesis glycosyltransferase
LHEKVTAVEDNGRKGASRIHIMSDELPWNLLQNRIRPWVHRERLSELVEMPARAPRSKRSKEATNQRHVTRTKTRLCINVYPCPVIQKTSGGSVRPVFIKNENLKKMVAVTRAIRQVG